MHFRIGMGVLAFLFCPALCVASGGVLLRRPAPLIVWVALGSAIFGFVSLVKFHPEILMRTFLALGAVLLLAVVIGHAIRTFICARVSRSAVIRIAAVYVGFAATAWFCSADLTPSLSAEQFAPAAVPLPAPATEQAQTSIETQANKPRGEPPQWLLDMAAEGRLTLESPPPAGWTPETKEEWAAKHAGTPSCCPDPPCPCACAGPSGC